ncbi:MAG: hypothetical protein GX660_00730 [Clostridiaceae bacterium]|nr:hypothetical protein [Clostridiaceae bacterium]
MILQNSFENFTRLILKNNKGISLVELLVTLLILTVVAAPFLGTFVASTNNNALSNEILYASSLAQKVMEEIKAMPEFLNTKAGNDSDAAFLEYGTYDGYIVKYRILFEEGTNPPLLERYEYEDINNIDFDMTYTIASNKVILEGSSYVLLSEEAPVVYSVDISENAANYCFKFYNQAASDLKTDYKPATKEALRVKIQYIDNSESLFRLKVNLEQIDRNREVYFYIIDDEKDRAILQNTGSKPFFTYDGITASRIDYSNVLYKIELVVEKDGDTAARLISSVKK